MVTFLSTFLKKLGNFKFSIWSLCSPPRFPRWQRWLCRRTRATFRRARTIQRCSSPAAGSRRWSRKWGRGRRIGRGWRVRRTETRTWKIRMWFLNLESCQCFFKYGANPGLFFLNFCNFLIPNTIATIQIEKSIDGLLGIRTQGCRMVGADKTTELWRLPSG